MLVPPVALRIALSLTVLTQICCDSSEKSKVAPCQGDDFKCESGDCVLSYTICDGFIDCPDRSDETKLLCKPLNISCPLTAFQCDYGACIANNKKCNGRADCADGSDETATKCSFEQTTTQVVTGESSSQCNDDEFMCKSGQCIDEFSVCDGREDCTDESDETEIQCSIMTCPPTAFSCSYGGCVEASAQCNEYKDCADNSDEDPVLCRNLTEPPPTDSTYIDLPSRRCKLPPPPQYSNYSSPLCYSSNNTSSACKNIPGTYVDQPWLLSIHCNYGYYFKETENGFYTLCINGSWSPHIPICRKMCTPLISLSVDVMCEYEGKVVDCNKPMRHGTRASGQCKPLYTKTKSPLSMEIICQENGQWNDNLFFCDPVCGNRNVYESGKHLHKRDLTAQHGEFPWHVGIYVKTTTDQQRDQWKLTCEGTLISPHIVLTAAHCLYSKENQNRLRPREIKVGLGKYHGEWTCNEVDAVKSDVQEIQIPSQFSRHAKSLAHDIALLDLTYSLQINMYIMPICVDWNREYSVTTGMIGMLACWGESDMLLYEEITYLNYDECASEIPEVSEHYITSDKFCAKSNEDSNAVPRYNGGGFEFVHNNLYYVYGVVSIKIRRITSSGIVIFTNVTDVDLFSWLSFVKKKFDEVHLEK